MSAPISPLNSASIHTPSCTAHSLSSFSHYLLLLILLLVPQAMDDQSKALSSRGVVDSGTMRSLVRAQEATGKAHVTIQVRPLKALSAFLLASQNCLL